MKERCLNKNNKRYNIYGERGINVCAEWLIFINFKEDMFLDYNNHIQYFGKKDTQLDRINNNKGYYKDNCRWVTIIEQQRNKNNNIFLTHNGQTKLLVEWAEIINIDSRVLRNRLNKSKWSVEKTLTTRKRGT